MSALFFLVRPFIQMADRIVKDCYIATRKTFALVAVLVAVWFCAAPAQAQIQDIYRVTDSSSANHMEYHRIELAPGQEFVLADFSGPGKVTYFYYTDSNIPLRPGVTDNLYPGLVLKVFWDDAQEPSIHVPLWNFFGIFSRKPIDYQSIFMQLNHYCLMSYLPMPFSRRARFVLINDGDKTYSQYVAYGIDYEAGASYATEKSRLHAAWNRSNPIKGGLHPILEVNGKGHYLGNFLQVDSKFGGWWGEGDTIFTIDGKSLTHTPGTEDEYGSCWAFEHTYSYLYSGYIQMEEGKNRMYRWYVANPVRFQKSLKVEIQNQRMNEGKQVPSWDDYTSVAFWYQEGVHAAPPLLPYAERIAPNRSPGYSQEK